MKTKLIILSIAALCLSAAPVIAGPWAPPGVALQDVLNDITKDPVTEIDPGDDVPPGNPLTTGSVNSSVDVTNPADYVPDSLDSLWSMGGSGGSVSTMIVELAGFATGNVFGLYDPGTLNKATVFVGSDIHGSQALVSILGTGEIVVNFAPTGVFLTNPARDFGFFLDSSLDKDGLDNTVNGGDLFYSNTGSNPDGQDHMYAYQGKGDIIEIPPFAPGEWAANEYILAFEDLHLSHSDWDYTDFVVLVESVSPVPVPGAVLLAILGLSAAGIKLRRFA